MKKHLGTLVAVAALSLGCVTSRSNSPEDQAEELQRAKLRCTTSQKALATLLARPACNGIRVSAIVSDAHDEMTRECEKVNPALTAESVRLNKQFAEASTCH